MNNYDEEVLKVAREGIGSKFYSMIGKASRRTGYFDPEDDKMALEDVNETLDYLMAYFNSFGEEERQNKFGGEFSTMYQGTYAFSNGKDIPLFMYLDLLDAVLFNTYENTKYHKELYNATRDKVQSFRNKLATLDYDNKFDPTKQLNKDVIRTFNGKETFSFGVEEKEGEKVLVMHTTRVYSDVIHKNGDYYPNGDPVYSSSDIILFQEDYDRINSKERNRRATQAQERMSRFEKYFVNGDIPRFRDLRENLVDPNLDQRIVDILESFCIAYEDKGLQSYIEFALSERCSLKVEQLTWIEKDIEKERILEEERTTSIEQARERYKNKSLFWKMVHRKLSVKKMDFDGMSTEEIGKLYTR